MRETFGETIFEDKWKRDKKTERGLRSGYAKIMQAGGRLKPELALESKSSRVGSFFVVGSCPLYYKMLSSMLGF